MSTTLTASEAWTSPVTAPAEGDAASASSVNTPLQALLNRIEYLAARTAGGKDAQVITVFPNALENSDVNQYYTLQGAAGWLQNDVAASRTIEFALPTIIKGTLIQLSAWVKGGVGGSHSGLPATMPSLDLQWTLLSDNSSGSISQTDTSASVGAYDAVHQIDITGLSQPFDGTKAYTAKFWGETGANSLANYLRIFALQLTIDQS